MLRRKALYPQPIQTDLLMDQLPQESTSIHIKQLPGKSRVQPVLCKMQRPARQLLSMTSTSTLRAVLMTEIDLEVKAVKGVTVPLVPDKAISQDQALWV